MFHLELVIRRKPEAINQTPVTRSYNYQCMPYIKGETNGYEALDSQLKVRFLVYKPINCNNKHLANTFLNDRGRALQLAKVSRPNNRLIGYKSSAEVAGGPWVMVRWLPNFGRCSRHAACATRDFCLNRLSMDWFQGKFTGQPHDLHGKINGFQ